MQEVVVWLTVKRLQLLYASDVSSTLIPTNLWLEVGSGLERTVSPCDAC